jgi:hypothetical protein
MCSCSKSRPPLPPHHVWHVSGIAWLGLRLPSSYLLFGHARSQLLRCSIKERRKSDICSFGTILWFKILQSQNRTKCGYGQTLPRTLDTFLLPRNYIPRMNARITLNSIQFLVKAECVGRAAPLLSKVITAHTHPRPNFQLRLLWNIWSCCLPRSLGHFILAAIRGLTFLPLWFFLEKTSKLPLKHLLKKVWNKRISARTPSFTWHSLLRGHPTEAILFLLLALNALSLGICKHLRLRLRIG